MQAVPGIIESSPGVRSCMIEYDQRILPLSQLLETLEKIDKALPAVGSLAHSFCIMHMSRRPCMNAVREKSRAVPGKHAHQ